MKSQSEMIGSAHQEVKVVPLVRPRTLTADELDDLRSTVARQGREHSKTYDPIRDELSINEMAAMAIGLSQASEFGEVFEIPERQYLVLLWEYVEMLQLWGRR
jgi:hypothetical protein